MEERLEKTVDKALESVFGVVAPQVNVVLGLIVAGIGFVLISSAKGSKTKHTVGLVCIGIGILGVLSGIVQGIL